MTRFTAVTTLDDAFRSLHLAIGLPDTLNGRNQAQFFLRIAVILGWLSVEEAAKDEIRTWKRRGFRGVEPRLLTDKLCLSAALRGYVAEIYREEIDQNGQVVIQTDRDVMVRQALGIDSQIQGQFDLQKKLFDTIEFKTQRNIRSDVVHDNAQKILTIAEGRSCLGYCTRLIAFTSGHSVKTNIY